MILSLDEARDILRLDGTDNDMHILALVEAIPPYLKTTTGYAPSTGEYSPVARTAARFILQLWYFGESADVSKIERVIECLLNALSAERERK